MIIDNLKDINSVADLFRYIANIEEENENLRKQIDILMINKSDLETKNLMLEKALAQTEHTLEFYENKLASKKEYTDD